MSEHKHVIIQQRINEAIDKEIEVFFKTTQNDPLINLILSGNDKILSLKEIKEKISDS